MKHQTYLILSLFLMLSLTNCKHKISLYKTPRQTENVIIVLIDGPRYSETWGEPTHQYIPGQDSIAKEGVILTNFTNEGLTNTVNGHGAITTGFYENLDNAGAESPTHPSIFQLFLEQRASQPSDAWIISSKDKLQVLRDCKTSSHKGRFIPSSDCGLSGLASGSRDDSVTFRNAIIILDSLHPHLVFISFRQPDSYAHAGDWNNYLTSLKQSDAYALKIWQFIQNDTNYKDKTTLFITNDHGRHSDGVADGFVSHGDACFGCRHILLLAAGPDFKENVTVDKHYGLVDMNATINYLFGLKNNGSGVIMKELLK